MDRHLSYSPLSKSLHNALGWLKEGKYIVIATVIGTWGSSPQPVGGFMIINGNGHYEGSVSGGCIESDILLTAQEMFDEHISTKHLSYSPQERNGWGVGLPCGGKISVLLERVAPPSSSPTPLTYKIIEKLLHLIEQRQECVLLRRLSNDAHFLFSPSDLTGDGKSDIPSDILHATTKLLANHQNALTKDENGQEWYIQTFPPPLRIIIIGAVHIAQELCKLSQFMGYDVTLIDPRKLLLTHLRFPDLPSHHLIMAWPDVALEQIKPDQRTAIVTLSHDKKLDDCALWAAISSNAFFIGALGSRRNQAKRLKRLKEKGATDQQLSRIHGPVGLDIGSIGAQEISLSIMAQIVSCYRRLSP